MTTIVSAGTDAGSAEFQTSVSSSSPSEQVAKFEDLGLAPEVLRAVSESGYTTPTPIQAKGIPHVLKRRDVIGIAQTGTGKTASFTLPMIEMLARGRAKARMPRSLILEPTRELAAQVSESFAKYGKYNKLAMALLIGGVSFEDQDKKLDRGVDVLIATPGRLLDHFERGKLMLSQVQLLVIDEADRMLDMGFIPDVERICKLVPFTRQTLFYSATMPPEIQRLTDQFLHDPVRVEIARPATTSANTQQEIVDVPSNDWAKRETLRRLIKEHEIVNAIVFCNRKRDVDVVGKSLVKHGFSAAALHGDLDQSVRTRTLDAFRAGTIKILVASDVAARGLDIPAVGHIFNFDVPYHADDYVHRIGRTGRAGRSGLAVMLASPAEGKYVDAIERLIGKKISRRKLEGIEVRHDVTPQRDRRDRQKPHRDRPIKAHGHIAKMEPAVRPVVTAHGSSSQSADTSSPARPSATHADDLQRLGPRQSHVAKPASPAPSQQPDNAGGPDGSRLPAFLFRPVPLPKTEKPQLEAKKAETAEG
jgi:superfamily II DNA/RNA helicase